MSTAGLGRRIESRSGNRGVRGRSRQIESRKGNLAGHGLGRRNATRNRRGSRGRGPETETGSRVARGRGLGTGNGGRVRDRPIGGEGLAREVGQAVVVTAFLRTRASVRRAKSRRGRGIENAGGRDRGPREDVERFKLFRLLYDLTYLLLRVKSYKGL